MVTEEYGPTAQKQEKITIQCAMCESQGEIESDQYEEPERVTQ